MKKLPLIAMMGIALSCNAQAREDYGNYHTYRDRDFGPCSNKDYCAGYRDGYREGRIDHDRKDRWMRYERRSSVTEKRHSSRSSPVKVEVNSIYGNPSFMPIGRR